MTFEERINKMDEIMESDPEAAEIFESTAEEHLIEEFLRKKGKNEFADVWAEHYKDKVDGQSTGRIECKQVLDYFTAHEGKLPSPEVMDAMKVNPKTLKPYTKLELVARAWNKFDKWSQKWIDTPLFALCAWMEYEDLKKDLDARFPRQDKKDRR